jgi:hypothetical protein
MQEMQCDCQLIAAVDMLFAVEAILPDSEVPDWKGETLRRLFLLLMLQSDAPCNPTTVIRYKPNAVFKELSKKTLVKVQVWSPEGASPSHPYAV